MKTKEFYTSPEVDVLVVQPEGVICQSKSNPTALILFTDFGGDNAAGASLTEDAGYDL